MNLSGVKAHKWQRISALYLLFYFAYALFALYFANDAQPQMNFQDWAAHSVTPLFKIFTLVAAGFILIHAWVGGRDIMIDYLPPKRLQLWLQLYRLFLILITIDIIWLGFQL